MAYKAIIFDLDGVICFTDQYHYQAWKQIADSLGVPFDWEINHRLRGVSRMESLEIILEKSPRQFSREEKERLAQEKNEIYCRCLENLSQKDMPEDVLPTLAALKERGLKLAIGSSSKNAKLILKKLGLEHTFDAVSDGTNIRRSKPAPDVFACAAAMLGERPEDCLVVEDAIAGVQAASAAGMDAACVGDAAQEQVGTYNLKRFSELLSCVG